MKNCVLESPVPDCTQSEPCWLGIDEAGRGPVLGPMVYGTCYSPISKKEELKDLNFADSKTLTEEKREDIFEMLNKTENLIGWMIEILSPTFISNSMLRRFKYNLNALSHDCAIGLIQKVLDRGVNIKEVYVDTVGDPGKYQAKLKEIFPQLDITVAAKADADYQIVGAASICAKVARDKAVKNWTFIEGFQYEDSYGSGYPNDPNTKKFMASSLDKVFGFPQFVRVSWSTAYTIIEKNGVGFRWEDDDEDDENLKSTPKLSAYFNKKDERDQRHRFFRDRCLQNVSAL